MIQYAKFNITCTSKAKEDRKLYKEFCVKLKKYLIDEDMQLYKVPILSEEYKYAHPLAMEHGWDWSREEEQEDYPRIYIDEDDVLEITYSKKDYENAAAYLVNFWYFAYPYGNISDSEYEEVCCDNPMWKYNTCTIQKKIYKIPSSEFKNRKYAQLMFGYAVSEEIRNLLMENKFAIEQDFQEVTNLKGTIVCYQLKPKNIITGFPKDNHMHLVDVCKHCGMERWEAGTEPYYISKDTLAQLKGMNQTREKFGPALEEREKNQLEKDEIRWTLEPRYIINKEVYTLLHKHYPRMQFIPIFQLEEAEFYYGKI